MPTSKDRVVVLDNGAYTAKVGLASAQEPKLVPNCMMKVKNERRRAFIGNQIEDCRDTSGLFYILPFQRGYLVKWDVQKSVWDYLFGGESNLGFDLENLEVIMTEPVFNFTPVQEGLAELFFEEYQVPAWTLKPGPDLSAWGWRKKTKCLCCVVVDCGYSFTHIVPYCEGKRIDSAVRRIDVGGKTLTNYLTEIVSYRQLNVMDESYVMNQVKEDSCFVSLDFNADMSAVFQKGNSIVREYVLPDYYSLKRGFVREPIGKSDPNEQVLVLGNERFTVPEVLFTPSDVGLDQMGVAEAVVDVIENLCPEETRPGMYRNIVVTGGCAKFPNFKQRLEKDVRRMALDAYEVNIICPDDPTVSHWMGGAALAGTDEYEVMKVTRRDYEEKGPGRLGVGRSSAGNHDARNREEIEIFMS